MLCATAKNKLNWVVMIVIMFVLLEKQLNFVKKHDRSTQGWERKRKCIAQQDYYHFVLTSVWEGPRVETC